MNRKRGGQSIGQSIADRVKRRTDYSASRRVEYQYYRDLLQTLAKYFSRFTGDWGSRSIQATAIVPEWLDAFAYAAARRMVTGVFISAGRTWRDVAWRSTNGLLMYRALRHELSGPIGERFNQLIVENSSLITSLPAKVAELVAVRVARHEQIGERARETANHLLGHVARARAQLIARTETSKATTALTQARSENLGLDWYVWRGSLDQRERLAHRRLEGVLIRWGDPPSPEALVGIRSRLGHYHAGNAPNCRCGPEPLVDLSQVSWPARVYYSGVIRSYTLAQFRKLSGMTMYTPVPAVSRRAA